MHAVWKIHFAWATRSIWWIRLGTHSLSHSHSNVFAFPIERVIVFFPATCLLLLHSHQIFHVFLDECMRATDLCAGVAPTTDHYKLKMSRVFTHWWPLLFESITHRDTFHYVKGVHISYGQVLAVWELSAIGHRKQNICT